jgi:purine-binding chemotaxis protein CheW
MSSLHVIFKVGESDYVLAAHDVLHMESFAGATRVPGAPPHVLGLVQTRGQVVPVIDLRTRLGLPQAVPTIDSRIIVTQRGPRTIALLVDSAREVADMSADQFQPAPEAVRQQAQHFVQSVGQVGKRLLLQLDLPHVIGEVGNEVNGNGK